MPCDPNTLLEQARQFLSFTEEQRVASMVTALAEIAESGGFVSGDFRITEASEIRITESGNRRIVE